MIRKYKNLEEARSELMDKPNIWLIIVLDKEDFYFSEQKIARSFLTNTSFGGYFKSNVKNNKMYGSRLFIIDKTLTLNEIISSYKISYCYTIEEELVKTMLVDFVDWSNINEK